ncbi:aldo/keto reductase [Frankia sp. AiPs1]|uniref:aldo/keto reductase n=1 Tax=Frankia sp. AiPs1 TaxID=573493 RepID=UPI0020446ACC|nr:aldo/keto reductase [Frankia sp. AiPs1]MCM3922109.1 aldo/keto reductase [Frankia sp. AiPs1]
MAYRTLDDTTTGTFRLAGHTVRRLGFGAMRISGARNAEGVRDRAQAVALTRRVYERGVNLIDTANIYGYGESEEIIAEALHPYPEDLLITTKAGFRPGKVAPGTTSLPPLGRPEHIRAECDKSLRRLRVEAIDLYQVHVPDPQVPYEDTVGAFLDLQREGKVRHIGVSNVTPEQLALARSLGEVVSVQNRYNAGDRAAEAVLAVCERDGLAFLPWAPVLVGERLGPVLGTIAAAHDADVAQVALAWLLRRSSVLLPIPGTSKIRHLDANVDAGWVELTDAEVAAVGAATAADSSTSTSAATASTTTGAPAGGWGS